MSWYAPVGALLILFIAAVLLGMRTHEAKATIRRFNRLATMAEDDMNMADWARHTMLTVTRTNGLIYAISLADLRDGSTNRRTDLTWTDPVCVTVWTGTPGVISRYRQDLADLQAINPEDTTP